MYSAYSKPFLVFVLSALFLPCTAFAQDYFDVVPMTCTEKHDGAVYNAAVDFPVGGNDAVMRSAKEWIGDVLEVDATMTDVPAANMGADAFSKLLDAVAKDFVEKNEGSKRRVEITWMYEDPTCVTYEAVTTDRDSVDWSTTDIACFSKRDGHRVQPKEIFKCDERQIKRLMWQYRGNLEMEVDKPEELYVGDCGFIDGWVIVVGPARGTSGAEYRLRYPEIEQWLVPARGEGYLAK